MIQKWAFPWFLPIIMLGGVALVSRPLICAGWVVWWVVAGRLVNAYDWRGLARTAPGTTDYRCGLARPAPGTTDYRYLRKPS